MIPIKNTLKTYFQNFNRKLKSGRLTIDELSLFFICLSVITVILILLLRLPRLSFIAWIPLLISYWRTLSKNRMQRAKENQLFIKHYYPIKSAIQNTYRRVAVKKEHHYFSCEQCSASLRIPKRTGHIKVTCPKCNHSFIKKTTRGHINKLRNKFARQSV